VERPIVGSRGLARTPARVAGDAGRQASMHDRLQTLQLVATKIVGSLDFDATLLSISNAAVDALNADMVGIMSADDDRIKMITCAGNRNIAAARFEARRGEGVAGIVFETGSSFGRVDIAAHPRHRGKRGDSGGAGRSHAGQWPGDRRRPGVVLASSRV
jgi:hypothetical protein